MFANIFIADRFGTFLLDLDASNELGGVCIESASWRLNDIGKLEFRVPSNVNKLNEANLRFGNRVYVEFSNGMTPWCGILDTPRTWSGGVISISAYSPEKLLQFKLTPKGRYFSEQTAGQILQQILLEAVTNGFPIQVGNIWFGGAAHSPEYHFEHLFDVIQDSVCMNMTTAEWAIEPIYNGSSIQFRLHLFEKRGTFNPNVLLLQGENCAVSLTEQGTITNHWYVVGAGTGWGDDRYIAEAIDSESIMLYGEREDVSVNTDIPTESTLISKAQSLASMYSKQEKLFDITALDVSPALFADYDIGDTVRLIASDLGFGGTDTYVRIIARELSGSGTCRLVTEESNESST